jgi:uncharacterized protein YcaQ
MITLSKLQDVTRLKRIALNAQKLCTDNPFGTGQNAIQKAVEHLGYVQLDTISVVERAHHHVMFSRLNSYQGDMLNALLQKGLIFEYWSHAAAYLPINDYRFSLPYKHALKSGQTHWHKQKDSVLMDELLTRIKVDGPLRSRDIESTNKNRSGWWDWKPAKKALEQLFMEGDLMVCDRTGFQKTYDLTERVLPSSISTLMPTMEEFAEHMLDSQLRCHGLVSLKEVTYLRRNAQLKKAVKTLVEQRLADNQLDAIALKNGEIYYLAKGALEEPLPRLSKSLRILSPFDNVLIQRQRLKNLFDFDYQIECYLPEAKRKYGYFSLPLLFKDNFIGRMDCKAHRKTKVLEIKSLHFTESSLQAFSTYSKSGKKQLLNDQILNAFVASFKKFMLFQNCETAEVKYTNVSGLKEQLYARLA